MGRMKEFYYKIQNDEELTEKEKEFHITILVEYEEKKD